MMRQLERCVMSSETIYGIIIGRTLPLRSCRSNASASRGSHAASFSHGSGGGGGKGVVGGEGWSGWAMRRRVMLLLRLVSRSCACSACRCPAHASHELLGRRSCSSSCW